MQEHIFVHKLFYVQAVTGKRGEVKLYSVTTRNCKFEPPICPHNIHPNSVPLVPNHSLGSFTFADTAPGSPGGLKGFVGA
jgi:hypothetical protein